MVKNFPNVERGTQLSRYPAENFEADLDVSRLEHGAFPPFASGPSQ
jgi:hypothetical protein